MRSRVGILTGVFLLLSAARAVGQSVSWNYEDYADTALTIPVGRTRPILLFGNATGGVSSYTIRIFLDDARVHIIAADSEPGYGLAKPTLTVGTNQVTVSASGAGTSGSAYLARLLVQMDPAAAEGSLLSFQVVQYLNQAGQALDTTTFSTEILNVCQAEALWGDPDSSLTITGRDALIALTYAVQLPVTGFGVALANVDEDDEVTSRDALIILSRAIGLDSYYNDRTGQGLANRCAPLAGVPSDMAFLRGSAGGNLYRVPAGDTIAVPVGSPTTFYTSQGVRWAPDGTKLLGTANTSAFYYEPIAVTLATLAEDTLSRDADFDGGGAYSPDGLSIAFLAYRTYPYVLWRMDATGANQVQAQSSTQVPNYSAQMPAWSPDGLRVAFAGYQTCCTSGLWSLRVDSGTVRAEFPVSASYSPVAWSWSPVGDSLVVQVGNQLYAIASPDTATVLRRTVSLSGNLDTPQWTAAGIVFRRLVGGSTPTTYDYYLRQPSGRILRVFRSAGLTDLGASFR
jgi:WD40-like Beta Propeller Repeat